MIIIDKEFQGFLPQNDAETKAELEKLIIADGCRDPIVLWNNTIIDGHHRHEICTRLNIPFQTIQKEFNSRYDVLNWMFDNQKAKRNLNNFERSEVALKLEDAFKALAKEKESNRKSTLQNSVKSEIKLETINTQKEIAKKANVSHDTIHKAKTILSNAPVEVINAVRSGEMSVNQAFNEIKKEEKLKARAEDIEKQKIDIEQSNMVAPSGLFDVISIDPPWNYGRKFDPENSRVANPYPEMTQSQLLEIELPAKDDSVLFLWTTHQFIFDAKELMDAWGFSYKATMVWNKEKIGMGSWLRMQCEFCLVGIKGKPLWDNTTERDIIVESRREHSRKPDSFFKTVEKITTGRRLEYFSREQRDGWEVFGNDTGKF